ncbi:hypothetical protein ACET3Z_001274 [Daucus carota]
MENHKRSRKEDEGMEEWACEQTKGELSIAAARAFRKIKALREYHFKKDRDTNNSFLRGRITEEQKVALLEESWAEYVRREVVQGDTCYYERLAVHSTYRGTGPNAGRMMSRCPLWPEGCGYMFWIDDPLEARATAVLTEMTKEMSDLIWDHHFAKERIRERHDEDLRSVKGKKKGEGCSKNKNER